MMNIQTLALVSVLFLVVDAAQLYFPKQRGNKQRTLRKMPEAVASASLKPRNLQTINLYFNGDENQQYTDSNEGGSGQATGAGTRSPGTATCRAVLSTVDGTPLETTLDTRLSFWYEVETVGSSPSSLYESTDVPAAVDQANVFAFADQLCGIAGWECVLFVHVGDQDERVDENEDEFCNDDAGQGGCFPYMGDILVHHTDDCSKEEILEEFVNVMRNETVGMPSDTYLGNVNDFAGSAQSNNTDDEVVAVRLVNPNEDDGVAAAVIGSPDLSNDDSSVNTAGWIVAAMVGLLMLLLLAMLYVTRRREKTQAAKLDDDMRSLHTDWSNSKGTSASASVGGNSYMTANMRNLAGRHSKLDVHKCTSATCEICRPTMGLVDMVPVNQSERSSAMALRKIVAEQPPEQKPWRQEERRIPRPPSHSITPIAEETENLYAEEVSRHSNDSSRLWESRSPNDNNEGNGRSMLL